MNIRPLHDRVIVAREDSEEKSTGGIVIPDSAKEKPARGKILAIGEGKFGDNNQRMPLCVKVGDIVLFGKYAGTEIKVDGEELIVMREDDIMAIIKG